MFLLGAALFAAGCSRESWQAKIYIVKAENASMKGYALRIKKVPSEERLKYYRVSCAYFLKAYDLAPSIFTLQRIEMAADACLRVKDYDGEAIFQAFAEKYVAEHPTESEYGDAVPISLEG